jgi:hypothetical protein
MAYYLMKTITDNNSDTICTHNMFETYEECMRQYGNDISTNYGAENVVEFHETLLNKNLAVLACIDYTKDSDNEDL